MDIAFFGKLALSSLIFAPGVFLLVSSSILGILIACEKFGAFGNRAAHTGSRIDRDSMVDVVQANSEEKRA